MEEIKKCTLFKTIKYKKEIKIIRTNLIRFCFLILELMALSSLKLFMIRAMERMKILMVIIRGNRAGDRAQLFPVCNFRDSLIKNKLIRLKQNPSTNLLFLNIDGFFIIIP